MSFLVKNNMTEYVDDIEILDAPTTNEQLLEQAVSEALKPILADLDKLEASFADLKQQQAAIVAEKAQYAKIVTNEHLLGQKNLFIENKALKEEISLLKERLIDCKDSNELRSREIAEDRQRISKLEIGTPSDGMKTRANNLLLLIKKTGKILQKDIIKITGLSKFAVSRLLRTLKGVVKKSDWQHDRRQNVLSLAS